MHLIEVNESTYDKLNVSLQNRWLKEFPDARDIVKTKNEDSSRICLNVSNSTACFLNNDPNSIDDWAFTPDLLESAPPFTRTLTTENLLIPKDTVIVWRPDIKPIPLINENKKNKRHPNCVSGKWGKRHPKCK